TSVKGIGKQTAIYLLIISRGFTKIKTARKCSCFGGMAPFEHSSGSSIKGRTKI
ncbi:MAG: IS110 family transposase, partial [Bacteroidetes bacterium]|nr:IS110 family transposase [Bacteroidota bacterium]